MQQIGAGDPPYILMPNRVRVTVVFRVSIGMQDAIGVADLDNLLKLVLDALNGLAWEDDRQVTEIRAYLYRDSPEVNASIVIEQLRDEPELPNPAEGVD